MVKGIDMFREYFEEFTEQYVLIGGSACDISFHDNNMDFRATKDLDMVLVVGNTESVQRAMVSHNFPFR